MDLFKFLPVGHSGFMRRLFYDLFSNPLLIIRYVATALSGTLLSVILLFFLLWGGLPYWLGGAITQVAGILYNFFFFQHLVFGKDTKGYLSRYLALQFALYFLHIGGQLLLARAGYSDLQCFAVLMPIVMFIGYAMTRLVVFPPAKKTEPK